ncbi:unnamed protein product [Spirodela intermedia]|uniref:Uncharacterized protein n=1 Tax=Spirodela intermedia TaxID=51605 RepID=A0A7I8IPW3_SPIIN|nr:unnamed protein product [Spirodela intermedia]CAA6659041.1 unnamed protein product [Spirodela intermedia]
MGGCLGPCGGLRLLASWWSCCSVAFQAAEVEGFRRSPLEDGGRRSASRTSSDIVNVSKRKVPNGADPIHNRRAGKAGRPPGRA